MPADGPTDAEPLLTFTIDGAIGNERAAMKRVAEAIAPLGLEPARLERLKTGGRGDRDERHRVRIAGRSGGPGRGARGRDAETIRVRVTHRARGPVPDAEMPDLDAKLEGRQKPRGWGLFLIRHMVDGMGRLRRPADRDAHPRAQRST